MIFVIKANSIQIKGLWKAAKSGRHLSFLFIKSSLMLLLLSEIKVCFGFFFFCLNNLSTLEMMSCTLFYIPCLYFWIFSQQWVLLWEFCRSSCANPWSAETSWCENIATNNHREIPIKSVPCSIAAGQNDFLISRKLCLFETCSNSCTDSGEEVIAFKNFWWISLFSSALCCFPFPICLTLNLWL